ncbi:hypothetical protein CISIN_1g036543mg [Citrus sinensis]|uniref:Uncharacterized protein n=1 Tax=Citrus sinensis TaxID=2711 RepID=A0A067D8C7_CITSI|nr:hypothetical protein CISIN_1g036543mg [Citrus sinensis]
MSSDPVSLYTPQEVAIGPYHHLRPELHEMERYKLAAARRAQRQFYGDHKLYDTLAWMMAIDASFLLEFLQIYAMKDDKLLATSSSISISHLKILQLRYLSSESADDLLQAMLMGFCEEVSTFKMKKNKPMIQASESAHLLDYLYNTVVPKQQQAEVTEIDGQEIYSDDLKKFFSELWKLFSKMILLGPIKFLFKFPCFMLSKIPGFSILAQPVQNLIFPQDNEENKSDAERSPSNKHMNKPPLVEEITILSVTDLAKVETVTLHIHTVSFDVYTEVVLRNLVAYEASNASGPLVLTRYSEFMNGIVDTEKDVKLLRENGIFLNRLNNDAEFANLWKGITKSIRLTKVPHIDIVIEDVNKYYNSRWRVNYWKNKKLNVFGSWQFLTFMATIMLLLLTALQAFCSVYDCRKHHRGLSYD